MYSQHAVLPSGVRDGIIPDDRLDANIGGTSGHPLVFYVSSRKLPKEAAETLGVTPGFLLRIDHRSNPTVDSQMMTVRVGDGLIF